MSWLDELKAGDKVHVHSNSYGVCETFPGMVERLTKTLVIVSSAEKDITEKFRKSDGHRSGEGTWTTTSYWLNPYSEDKEREQEQRRERARLVSTMMNIFWRSPDDVPLSALQQIEAILAEHGVIKEAQS